MESISKERRDFLKRASLAVSFAVMPFGDAAWRMSDKPILVKLGE